MQTEDSIKITLKIMRGKLNSQRNLYYMNNQPPIDNDFLKRLADAIQYTRGWVDCLEEMLEN